MYPTERRLEEKGMEVLSEADRWQEPRKKRKSEWRSARWQSGLSSYYNLPRVNTWRSEHFNAPKRYGKKNKNFFPSKTSSGEMYDVL